ncbi:MAG: L-2-hydroxyglutarate oxidase [Bacteriovoracaceae bacterium]|nr:L-2-hydroxyglutarate oxidase [Bacteriovoracaceae bacterium]
MHTDTFDITIVGAGIIGMSTAMQLAQKYPNLKIAVLEKEDCVAKHQTGHNSGVIHSGIYYKPGSLKARNTRDGIKLLHDFCNEHNIKYETTGKLIVATSKEELPGLEALMEKGRQNGIFGLKFLGPEEIRRMEPNVTALKAIFIPITGIINYTEVVNAYKKVFESMGGNVLLNNKVIKIKLKEKLLNIHTSQKVVKSRYLVNCAGLYSDHVAELSGMEPGLKIIPFRGEYYKINPQKNHLVNNLIYPVPDPEFPFLGVHFTRMIDGEREVGPNAVLAFRREGYKKTSFHLREFLEIIFYPSFWIMALKHWKMGIREMYMSYCKKAFLKAVRRLIPSIESDDLIPTEAGVRAQALEKGGVLVDDFRIIQTEYFVHVLNAPSPAATASLAIGSQIVERIEANFQFS